MTLQPVDASGSQRFTSDGGTHTGDVRALLRPPSLTLEGPLAVADYIPPVPIKGMPGLFYGKVTLHEARGPVRREGDFRLAHASRQNGTLVGDAPDVLRAPLLTSTQTTPDPATTSYRMVSANYQGVDVVGMFNVGATSLFRSTSVSDPTLISVPGYPLATNPVSMLCARTANFAGAPYLMLGFTARNGATSTLQALSVIAGNPPTAAYVPTGDDAVFDLVQLPDGTIMAYASVTGVGKIVLIDASVAPAAAVWAGANLRATIGPGGYFAGLQSLGGGPPLVYAVEPVYAGNQFTFDPATIGALRGRLHAISLDGWTMQDVNTTLPWVTFATVVRDGLMCCDQTSHVYLNGRRIVPMNWLKERYPNPGATIICRGHYTDGQRFWWKANEIKSGVATQAWWEEVHFDHLDETGAPISLPCSQSATLGVDVQTIGGWSLPYFPTSRVLQEYTGGAWYRQKQPPNGQLGYDMRKMPGGAAGSGDEFEPITFMTWAIQQYPGMEGCPLVTARITAPPNRHIRTGQDPLGGYTSGASVGVSELLSGVGETFHARGPDERRPVREFSLNRSWSYGFQPQITLTQQVGGTDPTRYTSNGFPCSFEFIFFKDGVRNIVPSQYRSIDASRVLKVVA